MYDDGGAAENRARTAYRLVGQTMGTSNSKHRLVIIDASLRDLVPRFLRNKRSDIVGALSAIELGDFNRASEVGHQLKGEGGAYGFSTITDMGREFEDAALSRNQVTALEWGRRILDYLDTVEITFKADGA
jgi:HPt (histidine-containing phosphotransfer) domain-containing protein